MQSSFKPVLENNIVWYIYLFRLQLLFIIDYNKLKLLAI